MAEPNLNLDLSPQPAPEETGGIDLSVRPQTFNPISDQLAEQRARKYDFSLGGTSPGIEKIKADIRSPGGEERVRQSIASSVQAKRQQQSIELFKIGADSMSGEDLYAAMEASRKPVDPDTAADKDFVERVHALALSTTNNPHEINASWERNPDETNGFLDFAVNLGARDEFLNRLLEDAQASENDQSYGAWANYAKSFLPFYSWSTQKNETIGETDVTLSWLPGNNKREQYDYINSLPTFEEYAKTVKKAYDEIKASSPTEAARWLKGVQFYTNIDQTLDNASAILDLAGFMPVKTVSRAVAGALAKSAAGKVADKASNEAVQAAIVAAREAVNHVPVTKASTKDFLDSTITKMEERVGKLKESASSLAKDSPLKAATVNDVVARTQADLDKLKKMQDKITKEGDKAVSDRVIERVRRAALVISDRHLKPAEMLSGIGKLDEAEKIMALDYARKLQPNASKSMQQSIADAISMLPTLFDPNRFLIEGTQFAKVNALRLAEMLNFNSGTIIDSVNKVMTVSKLPNGVQNLEKKLLDIEEQLAKDHFSNINGAVLYAVEKHSSETNPLTNSAYLELVFGRTDSKLFTTEKEALHAGRKTLGLDITEKNIYQEGDGYAIRIRKDADETRDEIRDQLLTPDNVSNTKKNKLLGLIPFPKKFNSIKDTISPYLAKQRGVATHATVAFKQKVEQLLKPVAELAGREREDFAHILEINKNSFRNPGDPNSRGMFYNTVHELAMAYMDHLKRLPTEKEVAAYAAIRQHSDADWLFRSVTTLQQKTRLGVEKLSFNIPDGEVRFEGVLKDSLPLRSQHDPAIYFAPNIMKAKGRMMFLSDITDVKGLQKKLRDANLKVIQVAEPERMELREALGVKQPIEFLVVPDVRRGPLELAEQVGYRPGFHVRNIDPVYVKQPVVVKDSLGRNVHTHDVVVLGTSNKAKGAIEASLYERAGIAIKNGDDVALQRVLDEGLPLSMKDIKKVFKESLVPGMPFGVVDSGQSTHTVRLSNGRTLEEHVGSFKTSSNSPYDLSKQVGSEYTASRNAPLQSIVNKGTEANPIWRMEDAPTLDVLSTQIAAMNRLAKDRHFNDLKIATAESFVQEFGVQKQLIYMGDKLVSKEELRLNPAYYLFKGEIKGMGPDAAAARDIQRAAKRLVSHSGWVEKQVDYFQTKLLEESYKRHGEKYASVINKTSALLKTDLPSKIRALAFHSHIGMLKPDQVLLQSQTLANISLISPKHGPGATYASSVMALMDVVPRDGDVLKHLAQKAAKLTPGWDETKFTESYNLMWSSGWNQVQGDLIQLNTMDDFKLYNRGVKTILDIGATLFTRTERFVRIAAWNTAYSEYIEKFPKLVGKLTRADGQTILDRAKTLSGDMTRDAAAFWQEGYLSTVTQFWGYTGRMFDLLTGNRLTAGEKSRLVLGWGVLYGMPRAATAAAPFYPWEEIIRSSLQDRGIDPNSGIPGVVMNGIVASVMAASTGEQWNIGAKLGPGPIMALHDLLNADFNEAPIDSIIKVLGGAGGSSLIQIGKDFIPVGDQVIRALQGSGNQSVMLTNLNNLFGNIGTWSAAERTIAAYNTGIWLNKQEGIRDTDVEPWEAIFRFLTAVPKQKDEDTYLMLQSVKDQQSLRTKARKQATEYARLMIRAANEGDSKRANDFSDQIFSMIIASGMTEDDAVKLITDVMNEKDPLLKIGEDWTKKAPDEETLTGRAAITEGIR